MSNLMALSIAGVIFAGLMGVMVVQTVSQPDIEVPGNHDHLASELYGKQSTQPISCEVMILNECWFQLGFRDENGFLNTELWDAIIDGVRSSHPHDWNASEAEVTGLAPGWVSFAPLEVTRETKVGYLVSQGSDCPFEAPTSFAFNHYPYNGIASSSNHVADGVYCIDLPNAACPDQSNGNPGEERVAGLNPDVVIFDDSAAPKGGGGNGNKSCGFEQIEEWLIKKEQAGEHGVVIALGFVDATDFDEDFQSYLDGAVQSYLGGLFDLQYPEAVATQAGANGNVPVSDTSIWEIDGALAASRLGALPVQFVLSTQSYDAPIIENLISRAEGGFLSWGERDDFDSAKRMFVHPDTNVLIEMKAWSAPSTN